MGQSKAPFRKVIKVEYAHFRQYNRWDKIETLECGHELRHNDKYPDAAKRRCKECLQDAQGIPA